jgi:site-specific recombinase XerD
MTTVPAVTSVSLLATLVDLADRVRDYADKAKSDNTRRAYEADWRAFSAWCATRGLEPMPASPGTLLMYLTDHAGALKVSTLQRRLSAIRQAHEYAGHHVDTTGRAFKDAWAGIRKMHGAPPNQKAAAMIDDIRKAVDQLPASLIGARNRALLLVGFAGALRR